MYTINNADQREIIHDMMDGPRVTYCPHSKVLEIHDDSDPERSSVKICVEDVSVLVKNIQIIVGEDINDQNEMHQAD